MDKLKFMDGSIIDIEDGASIREVIHIATNESDAMYVAGLVTPENISHIEFLHGSSVTGVYDNLTIAQPTTREAGENGAIIVRMHFRQKTDVEIRLDALEESQEIQDGAIEDIGAALSDLAEG